MASNGSIGSIAMNLGGLALGIVAGAYADSQLGPQYDITLMGDAAVPGSGVTLTPGLMAGAVAIAAGLALKSPAVALLGTGAAAAALGDIGKQKILPMVTPTAPTAQLPPSSSMKGAGGLPAYYGVGACGAPGLSAYELAETMAHYRNAAQA